MSEFKGTRGEWKITNSTPNGMESLDGYIEIASDKWCLACVFNDFEINDKEYALRKIQRWKFYLSAKANLEIVYDWSSSTLYFDSTLVTFDKE